VEEKMAPQIIRSEYYNATVKDRPGEAYRLLERLASSGVKLLAFSAVPMGHDQTQLMLFPSDNLKLMRVAQEAGVTVSGPQHALLIRGDDKLGALTEIHRKLYDANINVYASSGVTAECGRFGYVVYVKEEDFEQAALVLGS
jgi:hypothetical protein